MKIQVTLNSGEQSRTFQLQGRLGWTIAQLAIAGPRGVATVERPAPRWSAYVHSLRKRGIQIDTEMVPHGGTYSGVHARYRLACDAQITFLDPERLA